MNSIEKSYAGTNALLVKVIMPIDQNNVIEINEDFIKMT